MPINTDIRQAVVLALESQGADVGTAVRDVLRDIALEKDVLIKQYGEESVGIEAVIAGLTKLNAETRKYEDILTEVNKQSGGDAMRERIDAYAREERAILSAAAAAKAAVDERIADEARLQAALGAMESRTHDEKGESVRAQQLRDEAELQDYLGRKTREAADAAVKAEQDTVAARDRGTQSVRDEVAAIEAARVAEIKGLGDRAQAYARDERAREQAAAAAVQSAGDEKRARIDFYASVARAAEESGRAQIKAQADADEAMKRQVGDLKRQRIDAYAAADEAVEKNKRAVIAAADAEHDALERVGRGMLENTVQTTAATREQIQFLRERGFIKDEDVKKTKKQGEEGQKAGQAGARGFLELSRAVEDFTVAGPLGALNNIPGIMYDFGQAVGWSATKVAGVTAGVSALATVSYIVYQHWDKIEAIFAGAKVAKLVDDVKDLNKELGELGSKEFKTRVDYQDIDILKGKIDEAAAAQATLNRLRTGKTEDEQARSKVVSAAIIEGGGLGAVQRAVKSTIPVQESEETRQLRSRNEAKRAAGMEIPFAWIDQLKASQGVDQQNRNEAAGKLVSGAADGSEMDRERLQDIFNANPQKFRAAGVDETRFGAGLEMAAPKNLHADERRKIAENRKQEEQAIQARLAKARLDEEVVKQKAEDARAKLDAEVEQTVAEIEAYTSHAVVKQADDDRKAGGRADKAKEAANKRIARGAPKRALQGEQGFFAGQFQQATGANDAQSIVAGKTVATVVNRGGSVEAGMGVALRNLLNELVKLGEINRGQAAEILQFHGFVQEASMMIRQQNASLMRNTGRSVMPTMSPNIPR